MPTTLPTWFDPHKAGPDPPAEPRDTLPPPAPVTLDYSRDLGDWDAAARAEATRRATRVAELEAAAKMKPKPKGRK